MNIRKVLKSMLTKELLKFPKVLRKYPDCTFAVVSMYPMGQEPQNDQSIARRIMYEITRYLNSNLTFGFGKLNTFVIGMMPLTFSFNLQTSVIFFNARPLWAVPKPKIIPPIKKLTLIFNKMVWALILVSFLIIVVTWWIIVKCNNHNQELSLIVLKIWETTLLGYMDKVPLQWALRFVFIGYVVYCIHIQAVVISKIVEILTVVEYEKGIQNLNDLSESNISILIPDVLKSMYFHELQTELEHRQIYIEIHRLMHQTETNVFIDKFFHCVVRHRCAAFFIGDEDYWNHTILEVSRVFEDASATGTINFVFVATRHKYTFSTLNTVINYLIESGITNYFIKKLISPDFKMFSSNVDSGPTILTVDHVCIVFIFLGVGLAVSIIVFIAEIVTNQASHRYGFLKI
ncbi:hypothetical protein FQR65_LT06191 [Abscondita terminalis]|nr:hypothetical protein FQR65_LT06191 [Abscondita terminalis]